MKKNLILTVYLTFLIFSVLTAEDMYEKLNAAKLLSVGTTATGFATGERYRFIDEAAQAEVTGGNARTRSYLYAGMSPVSMTENNQTLYIGTDVRGSVRTLTDRYGTVVARAEYDAFGTPLVQDALRQCGLGYAGKPFDFTTQLYNYGFRDYSPLDGRFTSLDPIRYGSDWYAYAGYDPVNRVDLWGLIIIKGVHLTMQDERWGKLVIGGLTKEGGLLVEDAGCYLTGYASAAITLTGKAIYTPGFFNSFDSLFDDAQNFMSNAASAITGLVYDYWTKACQGDLTAKVNELNDSEDEYVVMAQVPYDEEGHLHWVEIYGGVDGNGWVNIVGTSVNDKAGNSLRSQIPETWNFTETGVQVKASDIVQLRVFSAGKETDICGNEYHY